MELKQRQHFLLAIMITIMVFKSLQNSHFSQYVVQGQIFGTLCIVKCLPGTVQWAATVCTARTRMPGWTWQSPSSSLTNRNAKPCCLGTVPFLLHADVALLLLCGQSSIVLYVKRWELLHLTLVLHVLLLWFLLII